MCDACDATLFNVHWTCGKCGFAVCADCYRAKRVPPPTTSSRRDSVEWMTCSANRQIHEPDSLMSTQIIPSDGNSLFNLPLSVISMRVPLGQFPKTIYSHSSTPENLVS